MEATLHLLILIHDPPPLELLDNLLPSGGEGVPVPLEESRAEEGGSFVDLQLLGLRREEGRERRECQREGEGGRGETTHSFLEFSDLDDDLLCWFLVKVGVEEGLLLDELTEEEGEELLV